MASSDALLSAAPTTIPVAVLDIDSVITESASSVPHVSLTLKQAAAQIAQLAHAETSATLRNAFNAAALKQRILNGEAGQGVKWMEWMIKHIRMSKSQLYALVHIGEADDPIKALEEWRRAANERSKNRDKKKEPLSEDHERMIKFILLMPPEVVRAEHLKLWQRYPQYR